MFGRKLRAENRKLEKQVAYLTSRLEMQARVRSTAAKKGWETRRTK